MVTLHKYKLLNTVIVIIVIFSGTLCLLRRRTGDEGSHYR